MALTFGGDPNILPRLFRGSRATSSAAPRCSCGKRQAAGRGARRTFKRAQAPADGARLCGGIGRRTKPRGAARPDLRGQPALRRRRVDRTVESPVTLAFTQIVAALLAGNCVVLKPPETCPLALIRAVTMFAEALPPGTVSIVTGMPAEIGEALTTHPDVGKIGFTGSIASAKYHGERRPDHQRRDARTWRQRSGDHPG